MTFACSSIAFAWISTTRDVCRRRAARTRVSGANSTIKKEAALLSGIRVQRIKLSVFVISAGLAAVSGILETSRLSVGQPGAGEGYELLAIGAAVIGGASLFGGIGSILGTALGTTLLLLIQNALILLGISAYWQQLVSGVIIVGAVALNTWRRKRA